MDATTEKYIVFQACAVWVLFNIGSPLTGLVAYACVANALCYLAGWLD